MLLKRNLLENITIVSNFGTLFCVLLHYLTDISLLSGKWLLLYIVTVFIVSVFFSFRVIQWLLRLNKPFRYDVEGFVEKYPLLAPLQSFLPQIPKPIKHEWKEYDTNELSVISTVLERKLVSSWYVPYISQDIGFPFACKQMLDQMIGKAFQICSNIETKDVFVDVCTILTLHLKEYEKAVKRYEKAPTTTIESLFKTSHPISDPEKKYTSVEHCTNILRIMIKELLPWELRDTPHSELLVRILSKKLDSYIDSTLADPIWLNDKLMTYLTDKEFNSKKEDENNDVNIQENVQKEETLTETAQQVKEDIPKVEEVARSKESVLDAELSIPEFKEVKTSPVMRQKRGRQGRNEVKIHDRIIEGSVKTWETDMDLQCISLGQDLLASLDGEITLSRLWGHEDTESSPEMVRKSPQLWTGEEEVLEVERTCPSPRLPSPNAADALLKDLQSTVSQVQSTVSHAKHKIGDLQVNPLDVYGASDEAAGMMEGLLDFGIAGLKKGLRFTGLSDDSQDKGLYQPRDKSADKSPPLEWGRRPDIAEVATFPLGGKDDNCSHPLVKQHRVSSQDSVPRSPRALPAESPEPQYEEAADLSTSIAKLRRLLRQRAEAPHQTSVPPEEVWWEGAEDRRARRAARAVEPAAPADEYDMSSERDSPVQGSNNMQRLDNLFHRTVTGVFNSLKTAVGAEESGAPAAHAQQWEYVTTTSELSVCVVAARVAWARRARGVEAALDPLQLPAAPAQPPPPEDLEEWMSQSGRAWAAGCGLSRVLHSHVAQRLATLLLADIAESLLTCWLEGLSSWLREQPFTACARQEAPRSPRGAASAPASSTRPLDIELTCSLVLEKMPALTLVFGSETATHCVHRALSGLSHAALNRDASYRVLDLLALHFKQAAGVRNPSFDNN